MSTLKRYGTLDPDALQIIIELMGFGKAGFFHGNVYNTDKHRLIR